MLLQVADGTLSLTGTDLEMEMVARVALVQPARARSDDRSGAQII
ncbi:hypothetical protein ACLB1O_24250 [Escherichia coli]